MEQVFNSPDKCFVKPAADVPAPPSYFQTALENSRKGKIPEASLFFSAPKNLGF